MEFKVDVFGHLCVWLYLRVCGGGYVRVCVWVMHVRVCVCVCVWLYWQRNRIQHRYLAFKLISILQYKASDNLTLIIAILLK